MQIWDTSLNSTNNINIILYRTVPGFGRLTRIFQRLQTYWVVVGQEPSRPPWNEKSRATVDRNSGMTRTKRWWSFCDAVGIGDTFFGSWKASLPLRISRDPKGKANVFQKSFFRGYVSFREGNQFHFHFSTTTFPHENPLHFTRFFRGE